MASSSGQGKRNCRKGCAFFIDQGLAACCLVTAGSRSKTHAAPAPFLSPGPPTMAVLPSPESATESPWPALPVAPEPTRLLDCWYQTPLFLVKIHAAPMCDSFVEDTPS